MINTLRITSVAAVLLAVLVLASVLAPRSLVGLAVKNDAGLERILTEPNVVERSKASLGSKTSADADQTPVLVKQAEAFAKILNPSPVALPKPPSRGDLRPPAVVGPARSAAFTVVGLSYSPLHPDESFAYVCFADKTYQWVRKGDQVGQFTVKEIRPNSILCRDGSRESEMKVVVPVDTSSLLETAAGARSAKTSAAIPSQTGPAPSPRRGLANDSSMNRIAGQITRFQQSSGGNTNDPQEDQSAVMTRLVSDYRSSQVSPEEAQKLGALGEELSQTTDSGADQKPPEYRRPLTSRPRKAN